MQIKKVILVYSASRVKVPFYATYPQVIYNENMNIYLDIDGVLLTKEGKPAEGVTNFLEFMTRNHQVYWLTTHCRHGDATDLLTHLQRKLPAEAYSLIQAIKPTTWDVLKTDGIDFSQDFLWFDDYLMESEKAVLKAQNSLQKQVPVDLIKDPEQLKKYLKIGY
jgi:hypothetical protein